MSLWDELQASGVDSVRRSISRGRRVVCAVGPTGFGKTRIARMMVEGCVAKGNKWAFFTHRRMLFGQTVKAFDGLDFGCRAAEWESWVKHDAQGQILMFQSEQARENRRVKRAQQQSLDVELGDVRDLPDAQLVFIDEAHANTSGYPQAVVKHYVERGARVVLLTATPVGLKQLGCEELVVMANNTQCREVGALLPAIVHAPDEVDVRDVKKVSVDGEFSQPSLAQKFAQQQVVGRVFEHWMKLNPDALPAVGFAPGVAESMWFCDEFIRRGVPCGHVDANRVYYGEKDSDGREVFHIGTEARDELQRRSREGEVKIVWNRFVCLDAATEILTDTGWTGIDDISYSHRVANWEDGRIYFEEPEEVIRRDRLPGEAMVVLETPRKSIRVTANHELLYRKYGGTRFEKLPAEQLVGVRAELPVSGFAAPLPVEVEQPDMVANMARRITSNAYAMRQRGFDAETSRAIATERLLARKSLRRKQPPELTEEECEFIGFWIGDGCRSRLSSGGIEYKLSQSASCPRIIARVDYLCESMGVDVVRGVRVVDGREHATWSLSRGTGFGPQTRRGLFGIEPYLDKDGSPLLWGLNDCQFEALIRGLWMADGTDHNDNTELPKGFSVCGVNMSLFDLLQAIASCRGWRASIRKYKQSDLSFKSTHGWLAHLSMNRAESHRMTKYRLQLEEGWNQEEVWCVKTSSGNIVTRRKGSVTVMGNCREGVDMPWLYHGIFATAFSTPEGWLQACGRVLRSYPDYDHVVIQDHGGSVFRPGLGHPDADRIWELEDTNASIAKKAKSEMERSDAEQVKNCPQCSRVMVAQDWRANGGACPFCQFKFNRSVRTVIQTDGSLKRVQGNAVKVKKPSSSDAQKAFDAMFFPSLRSKRGPGSTFKQLVARYQREYPQFQVVKAGGEVRVKHRETGESWKLHKVPPPNSIDWTRSVKHVPRENLQ